MPTIALRVPNTYMRGMWPLEHRRTNTGDDLHGAGAVPLDAKTEMNEMETGDNERAFNYVRLVHSADN